MEKRPGKEESKTENARRRVRAVSSNIQLAATSKASYWSEPMAKLAAAFDEVCHVSLEVTDEIRRSQEVNAKMVVLARDLTRRAHTVTIAVCLFVLANLFLTALLYYQSARKLDEIQRGQVAKSHSHPAYLTSRDLPPPPPTVTVTVTVSSKAPLRHPVRRPPAVAPKPTASSPKPTPMFE